MSVAFTFGSLGDIIAICQIAWSLGKALDDSRGSSKEYQELRKDLDIFTGVLRQVVALWQDRVTTLEIIELEKFTRRIVDEDGILILETLQRIAPKYHDSLGKDSHKNVFVGNYRKVEWSVREKQKVKALQEKLAISTGRLNILIVAAAAKSAKLDNATLLARMTQIDQLLSSQQTLSIQQERAAINQEIMAREQNSKLSIVEAKIDAQHERSWQILDTAKRSFGATKQVTHLLAEATNMLGVIFQWVVDQRSRESYAMGMHGLDPTLHKALLLEDPLSNVIEIPNWVDSWDTFDSYLALYFRSRPGQAKVLRKEYSIEESFTGKTFGRNRPWRMAYRPGLKVDMSMIFRIEYSTDTSCPRCHTIVSAPNGSKIQCINQHCAMWFQRTLDDEPPLQHRETSPLSETMFSVAQSTFVHDDAGEDVTTYQRVKLILFKSPANDLGEDQRLSDLKQFAKDLAAASKHLLSSDTRSRSQGSRVESQPPVFGSTEQDREISRDWLQDMPDKFADPSHESRVLIKLQFKGQPALDLAAMERWLKEVPAREDWIKIQLPYRSF